MFQFSVHGPFEIRPTALAAGRHIDKTSIDLFWSQCPDLADAVGCYVFGFRAGSGITPAYVGQAAHGLQRECFQAHKLQHYNEALLSRHRGTPVLFFVVKDTGPSAMLQACIDRVEDYLIQLAVARNAELTNVQRVQWGIHGVCRSTPGKPGNSARELCRVLGIAMDVASHTPESQQSTDETPDTDLLPEK